MTNVPREGALESRIVEAMGADRHRLRQRLRAIRETQRAGRDVEAQLKRWEQDLARSAALLEQRRRNVPPVTYDDALPVAARREEIAAAIRDHQVVIVCGETGSGKSTQLPKICLELGRGVERMIGQTQPRRIAARSIAGRIAQELLVPLGGPVGFKMRFTDGTGPETCIKVMTDGILLAETQNDRFLDQYDAIIVDEAHERSLNIDFLLGYLKRLLPKRPDLKVVITSATLDAERFAEHFAAGSAIEQVSTREPPLPPLRK
ncbi:MAG: ATP-dependent RNA helicase HrpA, partial [Planctomycetia bacterium]|nr:ATP-dependent RNA helicase HrpA [Planctomycetia bacterium]